MSAATFDLRRERLNKGLSIRGLARELHLADGTVRRIEEGELPLPATAKVIADFFEVGVIDVAPGLFEENA